MFGLTRVYFRGRAVERLWIIFRDPGLNSLVWVTSTYHQYLWGPLEAKNSLVCNGLNAGQ